MDEKKEAPEDGCLILGLLPSPFISGAVCLNGKGHPQKQDPRCIATPGVSPIWECIVGQGSDRSRLSDRWLTLR